MKNASLSLHDIHRIVLTPIAKCEGTAGWLAGSVRQLSIRSAKNRDRQKQNADPDQHVAPPAVNVSNVFEFRDSHFAKTTKSTAAHENR